MLKDSSGTNIVIGYSVGVVLLCVYVNEVVEKGFYCWTGIDRW